MCRSSARSGASICSRKPCFDDRLVLDLQCAAERREIGVERVVVLVLAGQRDDAGRGRAHERLDERAGRLREHRVEVPAFVVDRGVVEIVDVADRLRDAGQVRDADRAAVLPRPQLLELRIAVDVGARRPCPACRRGRSAASADRGRTNRAAARRCCRCRCRRRAASPRPRARPRGRAGRSRPASTGFAARPLRRRAASAPPAAAGCRCGW